MSLEYATAALLTGTCRAAALLPPQATDPIRPAGTDVTS